MKWKKDEAQNRKIETLVSEVRKMCIRDRLCAVTGSAAAVGVCAGAAGTQLELAGGVAVFPAQHLRADHHDFAPDVLLVTDLFTVLGDDGRIGEDVYKRQGSYRRGVWRRSAGRPAYPHTMWRIQYPGHCKGSPGYCRWRFPDSLYAAHSKVPGQRSQGWAGQAGCSD